MTIKNDMEVYMCQGNTFVGLFRQGKAIYLYSALHTQGRLNVLYTTRAHSHTRSKSKRSVLCET